MHKNKKNKEQKHENTLTFNSSRITGDFILLQPVFLLLQRHNVCIVILYENDQRNASLFSLLGLCLIFPLLEPSSLRQSHGFFIHFFQVFIQMPSSCSGLPWTPCLKLQILLSVSCSYTHLPFKSFSLRFITL